MTDEKILILWGKGWSVEKITNSIIKLKNIKDEKYMKEEYHRVEKIILDFYKN